MNEAEKTDFLIERINQNEHFQSVDINEWAFSLIKADNAPLRVLELCCGTGKQTKYLLKLFPNAELSCLDISADAIDAVKKTYTEQKGRMQFFNMGIDEFFTGRNETFDIIFCSYGLYYATDIQKVLAAIGNALRTGGRLIVMGPYGKNNSQLFGALKGVGVTIADFVMHSSSTFMYQDVMSFSIEHCSQTHIYTTKNSVKWQDTKSVLSYWKNSTFYDQGREAAFEKAVEQVIDANNGSFVNDKHIMLIEAIK